MSQTWLIRAGVSPGDQEFALKNGCAVIGWGDTGDISGMSCDEAEAAVRAIREREGRNCSPQYSRQPWHFANSVKEGHWVVLPLKDERGKRNGYSAVGKVKGGYQYKEDQPNGRSHQRPLEWVDKEFPDGEIQHPLTNQMTISKIGDSGAIIPSLDNQGGAPSVNLKSVIQRDIQGRDQGREMERLIAEILKAMGYACELTQKSGDDGVDIFASADPLGLEEAVCVEVKGGGSQKGTPDIRGLLGAMQMREAQKGLYVSWGGFGGIANQQKLKEKFPFIRLWDAEDVVRLVGEHYHKLDEFKEKIPRELVDDYLALAAEAEE